LFWIGAFPRLLVSRPLALIAAVMLQARERQKDASCHLTDGPDDHYISVQGRD
jgi:hypothetical protein